MIQLIKNAEQKQALIQRIADIVASRLVPIALMIACIGYLITGKYHRRCYCVLVVFCPLCIGASLHLLQLWPLLVKVY